MDVTTFILFTWLMGRLGDYYYDDGCAYIYTYELWYYALWFYYVWRYVLWFSYRWIMIDGFCVGGKRW